MLQIKSKQVFKNLTPEQLMKEALKNDEGIMTNQGSFRALTGKYTGRSPKDKFIVHDSKTRDLVNWNDTNKPFDADKFESLLNKVLDYLADKKIYALDALVGNDINYQMQIKVVTELAWHNLFAQHMFVRPKSRILREPHFTVISAPHFKANPEVDGTNSEAFIITDFSRRIVLIGGTEYAGEIKKSIFGVVNLILPERNVLSMHCSANIGKDRDTALFFGLSGTGKTTLSADENRMLIGDDEHAWSDSGVFNIEGGCYAKTINLTYEKEPQIYKAIRQYTVLENVFVDENGSPDYDNVNVTENTRAAYPIEYIDNIQPGSKGSHPKNIIFLTADAFGVLPPVSKLTKEQVSYYFLNGYTSKLSGTERGVTEPQATFSTCFGAPFLPLHPMTYSNLLLEKIQKHGTNVYLVNTGWVGGPYGVGNRINLRYTRSMITAILNGELENVNYQLDSVFGLWIPTECPDVPKDILNPMNLWEDKEKYRESAIKLHNLFKENFKKFETNEENQNRKAL